MAPAETTTKANTTSTEHDSSQYSNVYTPQFHGIINHIGVFVETEEDGPKTGRMFEVTGNIVIRGGGMQYEDTKSGNPEEDVAFVEGTKNKVGAIETSDFARLREICQSLPVPGKYNLSKPNQAKKKYNVTYLKTFRSPAQPERFTHRPFKASASLHSVDCRSRRGFDRGWDLTVLIEQETER